MFRFIRRTLFWSIFVGIASCAYLAEVRADTTQYPVVEPLGVSGAWRPSASSTPTFSDPNACVNSCLSSWEASNSNYTCSGSTDNRGWLPTASPPSFYYQYLLNQCTHNTSGNPASGACTCRAQNTATFLCPHGGTVDLATASCINAPACDGDDVRDPVTGACGPDPQAYSCPTGHRYGNRFGPAGESGTFCMQTPGGTSSQGCSVIVAMTASFQDPVSGNYFSRYRVDSNDGVGKCTPGPDPQELKTLDNESNVNCVVMGGNSHCWHKESIDCQYVNGEPWCFSDVKVQPILTAAGQMLSTEAQAPLVDGSGNPVTPDSKVKDGEGAPGGTTTFNHYTSSTVSTYHSSGGTVSGNPQQSGAGTGTGSGTGDGDGDGDGDPFGGPDFGEGPGFEESIEGIRDGHWGTGGFLEGVQGATGIDNVPSVGGASCPVLNVTVFGTNFFMSMHCDILAEWSWLISAIFMFGWSLASARIVLSA